MKQRSYSIVVSSRDGYDTFHVGGTQNDIIELESGVVDEDNVPLYDEGFETFGKIGNFSWGVKMDWSEGVVLMVSFPEDHGLEFKILSGIEKISDIINDFVGLDYSDSKEISDILKTLLNSNGYKFHRADGPAFSFKGNPYYFVNGKPMTEKEYKKHFDIKESKFRKLLEMTEQSYWLDPKSHSLKKGNDHEVMVEKDPEWFGLDYEDLEGMPPKAVALQAGFVRIDIFPDWVVLELPKKPDGKLKNAISWFAEQMLMRYNVRSDTPVEIYVFNSSDRRGTWNGKFEDLHSSAIFEGLNEDKIDKQIKSGKISGNPNSKELLKILERLGATIEWRGSDEYLISHPLMDHRIKMSTHRKDTPWVVIDWINKLIRKKKTQGEL